MSAHLRLRLEAELEKGDRCLANTAAADALEALAQHIRGNPLFIATDIVEVPRGRAAYTIDEKA